MQYQGNLAKLKSKLATPIEYWLPLGDLQINLNNYLGKNLSLKFTGIINCIGCGLVIKKSYQQGYCYPCTQKLASCDLCIVKPERCHYHLGTCREPEWGQAHCMMPHIIYLANSSQLKIGITRETQVPTRWIDQGATQALAIMRTQSRYQAGLLEIIFAKKISDKTNWRKMLQQQPQRIDLAQHRTQLFQDFSQNIQALSAQFAFGALELLTNEASIDLEYPMQYSTNKIVSYNFLTTPIITDVLLGIKGQYLVFAHGVLNIRNFIGYQIELNIA